MTTGDAIEMVRELARLGHAEYMPFGVDDRYNRYLGLNENAVGGDLIRLNGRMLEVEQLRGIVDAFDKDNKEGGRRFRIEVVFADSYTSIF